jgi:hypothetical protein
MKVTACTPLLLHARPGLTGRVPIAIGPLGLNALLIYHGGRWPRRVLGCDANDEILTGRVGRVGFKGFFHFDFAGLRV